MTSSYADDYRIESQRVSNNKIVKNRNDLEMQLKEKKTAHLIKVGVDMRRLMQILQMIEKTRVDRSLEATLARRGCNKYCTWIDLQGEDQQQQKKEDNAENRCRTTTRSNSENKQSIRLLLQM